MPKEIKKGPFANRRFTAPASPDPGSNRLPAEGRVLVPLV